MTFRAKPVVKRISKPTWDSRDRRNFYLNLGFGLAVLAAVVILGAAVAVSYYNDHLAPVGSVDGQTITKDDLRERAAIEQWRLDLAGRRIQTQLVAGQLTQAQAELQTQMAAEQRIASSPCRSRRSSTTASRRTSPEEGVAVTDADIDAQLTEEATPPEARHVPGRSRSSPRPAAPRSRRPRRRLPPGPGSTRRSPTSRAARSGRTSRGPSRPTAPPRRRPATSAGSAPRICRPTRRSWRAVRGRLNTPTDVVEARTDLPHRPRGPRSPRDRRRGVYRHARQRRRRLGQVPRRRPRRRYPQEARGQAGRRRGQAGPAAETAEIYLSKATADLPDDAVKVRHTCSPRRTTHPPRRGRHPPTDPSWGQAKLDAEAMYARLKDDVMPFDQLARETSDEESARGADGTGGVLDAYVSDDSSFVPSVQQADPRREGADGQLLPPIKTEFGYHLVQVSNHAPDLAAHQAAGRWRYRLRRRSRVTSRRAPRPTAGASAGRRDSSIRADRRDLRGAGRQDVRRGHRRERRRVPLRRPTRRSALPKVASSTRSGRASSATGTSPRRTPSPSSATRPSRSRRARPAGAGCPRHRGATPVRTRSAARASRSSRPSA